MSDSDKKTESFQDFLTDWRNVIATRTPSGGCIMRAPEKPTNPKDAIGATKIPLSIIPLVALTHCSLALFSGQLKYGLFNWRESKVSLTIYVDACLRHVFKYYHGEDYDQESGLHHLGHAMACFCIILDAQQSGNLIDDRPVDNQSAGILDDLMPEIVRLIKDREENAQ